VISLASSNSRFQLPIDTFTNLYIDTVAAHDRNLHVVDPRTVPRHVNDVNGRMSESS